MSQIDISTIETAEFPSIKRLVVKQSIATAKTHDIENIDEFKNFLINLLIQHGNVTKQSAESIFDDKGVEFIKIAFTHPSMLEDRNYEYYELLGDVTVNKCITWYLFRRIPALKTLPNFAMVMSELKKRYVCKKMFSNFCKKLGLDKYIRWKQLSVIEKDEIKEIILNDSFFEDVFEAFCGALEDLIDTKFIVNSGFSIIYNIIVSIMDNITITTNLDELLDSKTQIKELVEDSRVQPYIDFSKKYKLKYNSIKSGDKWYVELEIPFKKDIKSGEVKNFYKKFTSSEHYKVNEAEKDSASQAVKWFKHVGIPWKSK